MGKTGKVATVGKNDIRSCDHFRVFFNENIDFRDRKNARKVLLFLKPKNIDAGLLLNRRQGVPISLCFFNNVFYTIVSDTSAEFDQLSGRHSILKAV